MMTRVPFFTVKSPMLQRQAEKKAQSEARNPTWRRWNDAGDRGRPLQGVVGVPGITKGHVGNEKRGHRTDP